MARYILLAVEDNEDANALVHMIETWGNIQCSVVVPETQAGETTTDVEIPVFVRAMYAKPTLFCDMRAAHPKYGFTRGKKYGWYVCAKCGRPSRAWADGHDWFAHLGVNLLPVSVDRPEYRGAGKEGHIWDGSSYIPKEPPSEGVSSDEQHGQRTG